MGFGLVLRLKLENVPTTLAFWLVKNYNQNNSTLNLGRQEVRITPKLVNKVLGIPIGKKEVVDRKPHVKSEIITGWRQQFGDIEWTKRPYVLGFFWTDEVLRTMLGGTSR